MNWWHPGSKCFEEFEVNMKYITQGRTVYDSDIQEYAKLSGDYTPLHTNQEVANQSEFKGVIAQGLLTFSILTGLFMSRMGLFDASGLALLALDNLKFIKPVRAKDTITAHLTVKSKRESKSNPDFGVVVFTIEGLNQNNELFLSCEWHEWVAKNSWKEKNFQHLTLEN